MSIPFMAVGNNELGEYAETIQCDKCGKEHKIEYGTTRTYLGGGEWGPEKRSSLGFYDCGDETYIGTINGRLVK